MDANGKIYSYGQFIHDGELYFSNSSYQPYDYRAYLPIGWDCCYSKGKKKGKKQQVQDDIDLDIIDELSMELYEQMMYDTFFFDRTQEQIWEQDYKDIISLASFKIAYEQAEQFLYDDMNSGYYDAWEK
jgi:hypothetical protein